MAVRPTQSDSSRLDSSRISVETVDLTDGRGEAEEFVPQPEHAEELPAATADSDTPAVLPALIINEIGLGLEAGSPGLAGQERDGADDEAVDHYINAIELINPTDTLTETHALTVEFLNPARNKIHLVLPDGIAVPGSGRMTISQTIGGDADPRVLVQVLDAEGFVVNSTVIDNAVLWGLGRDASEPLAVNLVHQAGGSAETAIDTFIANLKRPDLKVLSSPLDPGVASRSKLISPKNFETYFADLSEVPNVFSRIIAEDEAEGAQTGPSTIQSKEADTDSSGQALPQRHPGSGLGCLGREASRLQAPRPSSFRSGV